MVTCTVSPPFPGLPHIYFLFTVRLTNERVGVFLARRSMQHLIVFDMWLWHGDLYRVSPFQVYCTSTSCLPCDKRIFHVLQHFLVMSVETYTSLTQMNEWGYS